MAKKNDDAVTTQEPAPTPPPTMPVVRVTDASIAHQFRYHQPDAEQVQQIQMIREAAAGFAQVIKDNTPGCPDQSAAIRHVRDAMMTANAAIVLRGR
jgi:hypothetical protein